MRAWSLWTIVLLAVSGCAPRAYYGYLAFELEAGQEPPPLKEFQVGFEDRERYGVHEQIGLFELDHVPSGPRFIVYRNGDPQGAGHSTYRWSTRPTDPTRVVLKPDGASGRFSLVPPDTSDAARGGGGVVPS